MQRTPTARSTALASLLLIAGLVRPLGAQDAPRMRILMSNDDGIAEVERRLLPVAQELRRFADVTIVVPDRDRSGTTQVMAVTRRVTLESHREAAADATAGLGRLEVHVVNGYPADCVALAIRGLMADAPPDLVITGPNGGPNLGDSWFGSGTIGAARTAAYLGVPAVAVSGLDADRPEQVAALATWVARLARSDLVAGLPDGVYLTVGVPRVPPSEVAGIRAAPRARLIGSLRFDRLADVPEGAPADEATTVWSATWGAVTTPPAPDSDVALYRQGYIVVTPMRADELDAGLLEAWRGRADAFPEWPPR